MALPPAELTYVSGRDIDDQLTSFLNTSAEHTRVALLFMPPRTGKTTSVREAAARHGYVLNRFYNGELRELTRLMVAPGSGSYHTFRELVMEKVTRAHFNLGENRGTRVLIHFDEAQAYTTGIETFRNSSFDFTNPPAAAKLAALVFSARMFCTDEIRLVVSGTALDVGTMLQLSSDEKCSKLTIEPTTPEFVKNVLKAQTPPVIVDDDEATQLSGHVGQLLHAFVTRNRDNNKVNMDRAFTNWRNEAANRLQWTIETALNTSLLAGQLPEPTSDGLIQTTDAIRRTSLFRKLLKDGAWMTVMIVNDELVIVPLSPWQKRALDSVYSSADLLLKHAFVAQLAATTDEKQKGFVFQFMFALELTRSESPLWKAMETQPIQFKAIERFKANQRWMPNVLYLVRKSSVAKLGDIIFVAADGTTIFALELKCGSEKYIWDEFKSYNTKVSLTANDDKAKNIVRCFVGDEHVPRLDNPTEPGRTRMDGTPDRRITTVETVFAKIVNGAARMPTHYILNPEMEKATACQFASTISRTESERLAIAQATLSSVAGESVSPKKRAASRPQVWSVIDPKTPPMKAFGVYPEGNRVSHLKDAIAEHKYVDPGRIIVRKRGEDGADEDALDGKELLVDDQEYEYEVVPDDSGEAS